MDTCTLPVCQLPKYNMLYARAQTYSTHWLQMQYILLLLAKTLITQHSLTSHKYSEGRAVIMAYIYPTWLEENTAQSGPQGWASPTRLCCHELNQDQDEYVSHPESILVHLLPKKVS